MVSIMDKKKGSDKKSWKIDCRTDCSFSFAIDYVLKESEKTKYSIYKRASFINIAKLNLNETINKCQTNPIDYKLPTALKLYNSGLKKIDNAIVNLKHYLEKSADSYCNELAKAASLKVGTTRLSSDYNSFDFYQIEYDLLEKEIVLNPAHINISNFYTRYHYPKVYLKCDDIEVSTASLLPTNDIEVRYNKELHQFLNYVLENSSNAEIDIPKKSELQNSLCNFFNNDILEHSEIAQVLEVPKYSFQTVIDAVEMAAQNPKTKRIFMTAYRLANNSKFMNAISLAALNGIDCYLYAELDARGEVDNTLQNLLEMVTLLRTRCLNENYNTNDRFTEAMSHIHLKLHYHGVKVHGKMISIDMEDRSLAIFGTGNFHEETAKVYKDYFYFSTTSNIIETVNRNFDIIWNKQQPILSSIAPMILNEIYKQIALGKNGYIRIQCNHLDNKVIVYALKEAQRRGCDVKMIIRTTKGFQKKTFKNCKTIVGECLEHGRIYCFGKGSDQVVYLSSSDLLYRNLYNRFESYIKVDKDTGNTIVNEFNRLYKEGQ